jgi:signal transduction histidine kinase
MKFRLRRRAVQLGIGAKATFSHISLAVLVIFFVSISMFVAAYSFMRDDRKQSLLHEAQAIAQMESGTAGGFDMEQMLMYESLSDAKILYIEPNYVATYLALAGDLPISGGAKVSLDAPLYKLEIADTLDKYFIARILSGESVADIRSFKFVRGDVLFAGAPVVGAQGAAKGGIVLIQSADVFRERLTVMLFMLFIVSAISIALAIAVSWLLSGRLTSPIVEITGGARRLAEGWYGQFIEVRTTDEIGELAQTLNTLSVRLKNVVGRLREERDKLDLIIDGIGEGIIAVDRAMRVVHCNEAFLRLAELGRKPMRVFPTEAYGAALAQCMQSRRRERAIWTIGGERRLAAIASPLLAEGIVIGAVCLIQDVSEAERLEQMRRDYVANVSHELRTPLTGIRGMVEPLLDGFIETEEEKQDCYRIIYQETIRLEKLIREMLDMSRLQDGRLTIEIEELEANGILEAAVRRVAQTAAEAGVKLEMEAGAHVVCLGNEDRILQALTILLDNALSFTPSGGHVTAYARDAGAHAVLGVRDTGCGIEPKDLSYIWERFYKVDKSRTRTSGTGLGLAIAKLIVELMGGEIGVSSEPGRGADFWFTLKKRGPGK